MKCKWNVPATVLEDILNNWILEINKPVCKITEIC